MLCQCFSPGIRWQKPNSAASPTRSLPSHVSMKRRSRPLMIKTVFFGSRLSVSSRPVMTGLGVASCGSDWICVSVPS